MKERLVIAIRNQTRPAVQGRGGGPSVPRSSELGLGRSEGALPIYCRERLQPRKEEQRPCSSIRSEERASQSGMQYAFEQSSGPCPPGALQRGLIVCRAGLGA